MFARYMLFVFCQLAAIANAETYSARVVAISDGDTVTVLDESMRQHRIRLAGIDAPEKRQPFGAQSKQHLSDMVFGKQVEADCIKVDRYHRQVCKITINGVDANLEQVKAGMAWWYRTYAPDQAKVDQTLYAAAENDARENRRGLWREPEAMAPWEWRRARK